MPIPTHREDCETKTWKTFCPDCGKPVYFLCCTCGSKVFFDTLGYPWHQHKESCPIYFVRQMINENVPVRSIRNLLDSMSNRLGRSIPNEVEKLLTDFGAPGKPIYTTIIPDPKPVCIHGVIKKCDQINIFKKLDIPDNLFIRNVLGQYTKPLFEVLVQEIQVGQNRNLNQWEFLIPCEDISGCGFRVGKTINADLEARTIFEDDVFWICTDWK